MCVNIIWIMCQTLTGLGCRWHCPEQILALPTFSVCLEVLCLPQVLHDHWQIPLEPLSVDKVKEGVRLLSKYDKLPKATVSNQLCTIKILKNSHQRRWQIPRPKAAWARVNLANSILLKMKLDLSFLYALY